MVKTCSCPGGQRFSSYPPHSLNWYEKCQKCKSICNVIYDQYDHGDDDDCPGLSLISTNKCSICNILTGGENRWDSYSNSDVCLSCFNGYRFTTHLSDIDETVISDFSSIKYLTPEVVKKIQTIILNCPNSFDEGIL